jgi:hypothetical protein
MGKRIRREAAHAPSERATGAEGLMLNEDFQAVCREATLKKAALDFQLCQANSLLRGASNQQVTIISGPDYASFVDSNLGIRVSVAEGPSMNNTKTEDNK